MDQNWVDVRVIVVKWSNRVDPMVTRIFIFEMTGIESGKPILISTVNYVEMLG